MARVTTMSGIASISGRLGEYCFRTMRRTGKVYMHQMPSKKQRVAKAPSAAMLAQRERFAAITRMVAEMRKEGSKKSMKQLWKIAKQEYESAH